MAPTSATSIFGKNKSEPKSTNEKNAVFTLINRPTCRRRISTDAGRQWHLEGGSGRRPRFLFLFCRSVAAVRRSAGKVDDPRSRGLLDDDDSRPGLLVLLHRRRAVEFEEALHLLLDRQIGHPRG